jgi:hypothetical protein
MTKREWKPGDVAALHYSFADAGRAIRVSGCKGHGSCDHWHFANGNHGTGDGASEIRPLVVIDPEDREQVERLYRAIYRAFGDDPSDYSPDDERDMQAALREFADPKPPKPAEPTGLGAVVEDIDAALWVHSCQGGRAQWMRRNNPSAWREWSEIDAVRVLSEGVQS